MGNSPFKIIFIHGYTASPQADWYPQISKELQKLNIDFSIPLLPGDEHPHAHEWLEVIHKEVLKTDKSLVFVGHSLGTRAALLYLEKYPRRVEKVFLIAAFNNKTENAEIHDGETFPNFFEHEINIDVIKPSVGKFIVLHSTDDSSINYAQGEEIAKQLDAELITYIDRDHFSDPNNAPYILEVLRNELQF